MTGWAITGALSIAIGAACCGLSILESDYRRGAPLLLFAIIFSGVGVAILKGILP